MDEKRHQYYAALSKIFEQHGWRLFMEDVEQQIQNAKDALPGVVDLRALGILQGRIHAFSEIQALQATIESHIAALREDEDADL